MKRRELLTLLGGTAGALPFGARARTTAIIGYLDAASPTAIAPAVAAFRQGLADTGYVVGQNLTIEYRWAEGRFDQLPPMARELVEHRVDLIATSGGTPVARAAKNATATIPIVFISGGDPVGDGLVAGLARPGGNLTGVSILTVELMAKRLQLLSELVPPATVIALLVNPNNPNAGRIANDVQEAARTRGIRLPVLKAGSPAEIDAAFAALDQLQAGAFLIGADPFFGRQREQLVALAEAHAIPVMYEWRDFAEAGGLVSYGTNRISMFRQAGVYAGRILKGENPADLPVQQPTAFELVVNLKTAKALGLTVPRALLVRVDQVIE